jgi:ADP-ribose pyrophosphatase
MADLRPWKTVSREVVFSGGPIREVSVESVRLPDERVIPDYYVIRLPDYALVFAEMDDGRVPMLRQYKHGPRRVCLTFPGGGLETGEAPVDAARRELMEELGCVAQEIDSLGAFMTNANQGCNMAHLFRARGCRIVSAPTSRDLEDAEVILMDRAALASVRLEEIGLAAHVVLLLLGTRAAASFGGSVSRSV